MSRRRVDEIETELQNQYGMMMNLRQCGEVLGLTKHGAIIKFLSGVPYCEVGREHKYLVRDVAKRIDARSVAT